MGSAFRGRCRGCCHVRVAGSHRVEGRDRSSRQQALSGAAGILLVGTALLAPLYQVHLHTDISL